MAHGKAQPLDASSFTLRTRLLTVEPHMSTVGQAKEKTRDKMATMLQEKVTAQVNLGKYRAWIFSWNITPYCKPEYRNFMKIAFSENKMIFFLPWIFERVLANIRL